MLDAAELPVELQHRLLVRVLATLAPGGRVAGPSIERWRQLLVARRRTTLAGIIGNGRVGKGSSHGIWRFEAAPARRPASNRQNGLK